MEEIILNTEEKMMLTIESTVISMRITKAMLADIDKIAAETGRTRNELMSLGLEFALKHIKIIDK